MQAGELARVAVEFEAGAKERLEVAAHGGWSNGMKPAPANDDDNGDSPALQR